MKKEIEKNGLGDLVIDRAKSNEEIPNQMDTLDNEFQGMWEDKELANEREEEEADPAHLEEGDPFCERDGNSKKRGMVQNKKKKRKGCAVGDRNGS